MPVAALSVVVCTRNRADYLGRTLSFYQPLAATPSWELVIVDNGSQDATASILHEFAAAAAFPCRIVSEPIAGLSRARNAGWRAATGEVIVFTDDDCYPEPDFLDKVRACYADSRVHYLGGRILLYDAADYPVTIQTCDRAFWIEPKSFVPAGVIQGANMSALKKVLNVLHGFDEDLGAGTAYPCEDIDFVSRASAAGFVGLYDPRPVVLHHHRRRTKVQVRTLMRAYDVGRGAYLMKCLLDPLRRRQAAKNWSWTVRSRLRDALSDSRALLASIYELAGAFRYLYTRMSRRVIQGPRPG